jgi:hypothetical protein
MFFPVVFAETILAISEFKFWRGTRGKEKWCRRDPGPASRALSVATRYQYCTVQHGLCQRSIGDTATPRHHRAVVC